MEPVRRGITIWDIAIIGVMAATLTVGKTALAFLANIEVVTPLIIIFTLVFGLKTMYAVFIFVMLQGLQYSFGTWWIMYLYIWPLLCLITWLLRKKKSRELFSFVAALFGLFFGMICAVPEFVIGLSAGGLRAGLYAGFTWWIAGIPMDIVHCIGNAVLTFVLYEPLTKILVKINKGYGIHDS